VPQTRISDNKKTFVDSFRLNTEGGLSRP